MDFQNFMQLKALLGNLHRILISSPFFFPSDVQTFHFIFGSSFYRGLLPLWGRNIPCNMFISLYNGITIILEDLAHTSLQFRDMLYTIMDKLTWLQAIGS